MGLDMRLYVSVWSSEYTRPRLARAIHDEVAKELGVPAEVLIPNGGIGGTEVRLEIAYWRKANAIHGWIVDNCAEGRDECQEIGVGIDQLRQLRDLCRQTRRDPTLAAALLPPREGFFFGSQDVDAGYQQDLTDTIAAINRAEAIFMGSLGTVAFSYRASW